MPCDNFMEEEFEEGDCEKLLHFLEMLGKAKHEPRYISIDF